MFRHGRCSIKNRKKSGNILDYAKKLSDLAEVSIPDAVVDRAHRIGCFYKDRAPNKSCKGIIVRFTTFRHRRMLYVTRSNFKEVKISLDLTKSQYDF